MLGAQLITKLRRCCADLHALPSSKDIPRKAVAKVAELAEVPYVELWLKDDESSIARLSAVNDETYLSEDFPRILPLDTSVVGEVITTGAVKIHPDLRKVRSWRRGDWSEKKGLTRYLGVPLVCDDLVVGAFSMLSEQRRQLGEVELKILQLFAEQTAFAYVCKQGENVLRKHRSRLEELVEERTAHLKGANERLRAEVAERKRTGEALIKARARLEHIFNTSPALVYTCEVGDNWPTTFVSNNINDLLGYEPREFVENPKFWVDNLHPEDKGRVLAELAQVFESNYHSHEYRFRHKDGTYRWMRDELKLIRDEDGRPLECIGYWVDITGKKDAEEALRQSESKYRMLMEQASDGIFLADQQGNYIGVNAKACSMLGYTEEELLNLNIRDLIPEEDLAQTPLRFAELIAGQEVLNERRLRCKDGNLITVEISSKMLADGRFQGIVRDITERKRAEEQLRIKETAIESSINALAMSNLAGSVTYVNDSFLKMWRYKDRDEVLGRSAVTFAHEEKDAWAVIEVLHEMGSWVGELVAKRKDGSLFDVQVAANMVKDEAGQPLCMLASFADVTERKLAEEELRKHRDHLGDLVEERTEELARAIKELETEIAERKRAEEAFKESEEKYRALMKNASDAILLADTEGNLLEANKKAEELLGYSREEILSMKFTRLHPEDELERTIEAFKEHIERGFGVLSDAWVLRKDGTRVPVDISASVNVFSGKKISQAIFRDITERKQAEETLLKSLREKELLLHEVNHRVNNNLQLISSLLDMTGSRSESQEARELVSDCRARIHAMAFIHSELYQSAGFEKINLARVARTLMEHLKRVYLREGTKITVRAQTEGVELPLSQAVPCTLVINELVTNALKHAFVDRASGTVCLRISELPDEIIRILVQDDGVGMTVDGHPYEMSSLGLRLVNNLVEKQLKGTLEFHLEKGTTFCVEFPKGGLLNG